VLGEADFDLAYYANNPTVLQDNLKLKNCKLDSNAYIEIYIKTNSQEVLRKNNQGRESNAQQIGGGANSDG